MLENILVSEYYSIEYFLVYEKEEFLLFYLENSDIYVLCMGYIG